MEIEDKFTVSKSFLDIFVMKYSDKFLIIFIIVFSVWRFFIGDFNRLIATFPILLFLILSPAVLFRKFAYKVIVDQKKGEFTFFMARKKNPLTFKIKDLRKINVNFTITFEFDNQKIIFNNISDKQFIIFLNNVKPVTYKFFGRFAQKYLT